MIVPSTPESTSDRMRSSHARPLEGFSADIALILPPAESGLRALARENQSSRSGAAKARSTGGPEEQVPETELVVLFDPLGTAIKLRLGPDVVFTD